jgi:hypothetical protein
MVATIRDCRVDEELRNLIPIATWDERADLEANVRQFGYLAPIIVWRNEFGEIVILDGHARWELWRSAIANPNANVGLAAREPSVVELALADRDAVRLWIINNQLGRRNIANLDRIQLVAEREKILKRLAKARQSAGGGDKQITVGTIICTAPSALLPKALAPIDSRKESAAEAGVSEKTYAAGKQILAAVADGKLSPTVVDDIRSGTKSIHGVAKHLQGKAARKAKSGWQTIVREFSKDIRRIVRTDPQRRGEVAAELRRLADEFESVENVAA